mgnify:CR=1 FL=1
MPVCVACNSLDLREFCKYRYDMSDNFFRFCPHLDLYRCQNCGLVQVDHDRLDLDALTAYYAEAYRGDGHSSAGSAQMRNRRYQRGAGLLRWGAAHIARSPTRVFEFGAGHLLNMAAAHDLWPEAALFCDDADADTMSAHTDLAVTRQSLESAEGRFDVILLCHVLEHLKDPAAVLEMIHAHLAPGGVLIIEVPNDRPDAVLRHPVHDPHVTFFTMPTMERFFAAALADRFSVRDITTAGPSLPPPGFQANLVQARRYVKRKLVKVLGIDIGNPLTDTASFEAAASDNSRSLLRVVATPLSA